MKPPHECQGWKARYYQHTLVHDSPMTIPEKANVAPHSPVLTRWAVPGWRALRLERSYLNFFSRGSVELVAFRLDAAGDIRSRKRVRPTDAIQLASASTTGTDLFVTNFNRLSGLVVSGVTFVTGIERIPY